MERCEISVDPATPDGDYACKVYYRINADRTIEVVKVEYQKRGKKDGTM
jgi:hypothetical protein